MKLNEEHYDNLAVLAAQGDWTADDDPAFRKSAQACLDDGKTHDFVLDLSAVEFVDSKGLEALLWLQERCGEKLGQVRLVGLGPNLQKIFQITRLASHFDCHADVDSAIKSLRS